MDNKIVIESMEIESGEEVDEDDILLRQALVRPEPVPGEDLSGPPMDGEQYLRRVIEESKKCEGIVVAKVEVKPQQYGLLPDMPIKKDCNSAFLPTKKWQLTTISDFSKLRLRMEAIRQKAVHDPEIISLKTLLPFKEDDEAWLKIVLNERTDYLMAPSGPSTKLCLAMSQVKLWHILALLKDWLEDNDIQVQVGCCWIYCLLACLELPVAPDIYFTLRQIARTLSNYRSQIESPESEDLPHINLLVCIIGRYFNQMDLADPFK